MYQITAGHHSIHALALCLNAFYIKRFSLDASPLCILHVLSASSLTPLQETLYTHLLSSKEIKHAREGKQLDTLGAIRQLINICRCA